MSISNQFYLVIAKDSIIAVTGKGNETLSFPKEVMVHQEIKNKKEFEKLIRQFLEKYKSSLSYIFLSDDVVFQKKITLAKDTAIDTELTSFLDIVPFPPEIIEKKIISDKKNALFVATNADIYKTIIGIAQDIGIKIKHVIPLSVFGNGSQELSYANLSQFVKRHEEIKISNFLTQDEVKSTTEQSSKRQLIVLAISLMFFMGAIVLLLINLGIISYKSENNHKVANTPPRAITPSVTTNISPTISVTALQKDATIDVLNASGISGMSKKVQDQLAQQGYNNISIGDSTASVSGTLIQYDASVSAQTKQDIQQILSTFLSNIVEESSTQSGQFGITITIGKQ